MSDRYDTERVASEPDHDSKRLAPTRRAFLTATTASTLALAGCSGDAGTPTTGRSSSSHAPSTGASATPTATETLEETESQTPPSEAASRLQTARGALDAAFTEMYTIDLVQFDEKVWTPQYRKLGNMDPDVVDERVVTAETALSEAADSVQPETEQALRVELLGHVTTIAEHGSTFYRRFALTFEKVYQYEYLIDGEGEYERAVEKMGKARELLATWKPLGEKLTEHVRAILQLYDDHDSLEAKVPAFDVERWNYTTFGAEQYAYLLQPRFVAFEAYAEAVRADLEGVEYLKDEEYQAAQEAFQTARSKIGQADLRFSEANSRGDSFFERRAGVYENRIPLLDEGYLLHLRAANEFVRGNTEKANDLRFRGTTKIRNAGSKYPIVDES